MDASRFGAALATGSGEWADSKTKFTASADLEFQCFM